MGWHAKVRILSNFKIVISIARTCSLSQLHRTVPQLDGNSEYKVTCSLLNNFNAQSNGYEAGKRLLFHVFVPLPCDHTVPPFRGIYECKATCSVPTLTVSNAFVSPAQT